MVDDGINLSSATNWHNNALIHTLRTLQPVDIMSNSSSKIQERLGGEISFVSSSGKRMLARIQELKSESLTFELVSADTELRVSEILNEVVVTVDGKRRYEGELQVSGLVPLGVTVLCEARLREAWNPVNLDLKDFADRAVESLVEYTENWAQTHEIRPVYRTAVADFETYLVGLENWCHEVDQALAQRPRERRKLEREILDNVGPTVCAEIDSHFNDFEVASSRLDEEQRRSHRLHAMKAVHRFFLQSPFTYRCFKKPLGYAGDYEMVNMMMLDPFQGASLFAKLLNNAFLHTGPVVAHRNRITYLVATLEDAVERCQKEGRRARILNLGCGPAQEIRDFIRKSELAKEADFELLDFSEETLRYAEDQIELAIQESGNRPNLQMIELSIQNFLKKVSRGESFEPESYDLVYCAGLFDYLQQKFCAKLVDSLGALVKSDGLVVVTNVTNENTIPFVMEDLLEWSIIHRNSQEMLELGNSRIFGEFKELKSDVTSINWFLELRRSESVSNVRNRFATVQQEEAGSGVPRAFRARGSGVAGSELSNH